MTKRGYLGLLEIDDRWPVCSTGDGYIFFAFRRQVAVDVDERHGSGENAHADRRPHSEVRREPGGDDPVDVGWKDVDPAGHADDGRDGKGGEAPDDDQGDRGQDGRPEHRQGYFGQRPADRGPADLGRFLQGDVEGGHGRGNDQVGDGEIQQAFHENHSRHGVDIEGGFLQVEKLLEQKVDEAVRGIQKEKPADGEQDVRDHHRDDRDDPEQGFERDVGSGVEIGQKECEARCHDGRADGEDRRVEEDVGKGRIRVDRDVLAQRKTADGGQALGEAAEDEHEDRADRQKSDNDYQAQRRDPCCPVHPASPVHPERTEQ